MGSLASLGSRLSSVKQIGLDSAIFIYYAEAHEVFGPPSREIFKLAESGQPRLCASTLVLTEVLTGYRRSVDWGSEDTFWNLLWNLLRAVEPILVLEPLTMEIADRAASLRASYNLRTPDAIHLATSLDVGAEVYITNDRKLKAVKEVPVLMLSELVKEEK